MGWRGDDANAWSTGKPLVVFYRDATIQAFSVSLFKVPPTVGAAGGGPTPLQEGIEHDYPT